MNKRMAIGALVGMVGWWWGGNTPAGSLAPTNTPAPTMHTLEEIYQTVSSVLPPPLLAKTGQTNSYATGDDGDLQMGVPWPIPRFTVQSDTNVVLDNLTGLMWTRDANLFGATNWAGAVDNCNNLVYGGYDDWRLPNRLELHSLADAGRCLPSLCNTEGTGKWTANDPFRNVIYDTSWVWCYWSSTVHLEYESYAWCEDMSRASSTASHKDTKFYTWPVRGGR